MGTNIAKKMSKFSVTCRKSIGTPSVTTKTPGSASQKTPPSAQKTVTKTVKKVRLESPVVAKVRHSTGQCLKYVSEDLVKKAKD